MAGAVVKGCKILGTSAGVKGMRACQRHCNSISGGVRGCRKGVLTSVHANGEGWVVHLEAHRSCHVRG